MRDYFLQTKRLGFGQWTTDDVHLTHQLWGDADVTRLIGGPFSLEQIQNRLDQEINHQQIHGFQYWPLFELNTQQFVGSCGLKPRALGQGIVEMGYQLRVNSWGKGYATEAAGLVLEYAFSRLNLSAVYAGHHPDNHGSRKILLALGFEYTHEEFYVPTQQMEPSYLLTRERYLQSN